MKKLTTAVTMLTLLAMALVGTARADDQDGVGARAGAGVDINGGPAFGAELNYTKELGNNAAELGIGFYGGSFDETSDEGMHTYNETTDIFVVAVLANYLFQYSLETSGPYFVVGAGFGAISVEWEERSPTDGSLGTPLPGGGSMQSEDVSAGGTLLNLGIGHRFSEKVDIRAQVPTFFIFSAPGEATSVVPTLTVTLGLRL